MRTRSAETLNALTIAVLFMFRPGLSLAQGESEKYRYSVVTEIPGARVFVGTTFKGVTPYTSDWTPNTTKVTYAILQGGFRAQLVTLRGRKGQTVTAQVRQEPFSQSLNDPPDANSGFSLKHAQTILSGFREPFDRKDLIGREFFEALKQEAENGFPAMSRFLTQSFRNRIARAFRAGAAQENPIGTLPLPYIGDMIAGRKYRSEWSVFAFLKSDSDSATVDIGIGTPFLDSIDDPTYWGDDGVCLFDDGSHGRVLFVKEEGIWKIDGYQDIGHDEPDEL